MEKAHNTTTSSKTAERVVITGFGLMTAVGETWMKTAKAILDGRSYYQSHETVRVMASPGSSLFRGATISRVANQQIPYDQTGGERLAALISPPVSACLACLIPVERQTLEWKIMAPCAGHEKVILKGLAKIQGTWRCSSDAVRTGENPRTVFFAQIAQAIASMLSGRSERFVVACADSLCDTPRLNELFLGGFLKNSMNPYGIMAGEAGGAVLLEMETTARKRGAPILAAVAGWGEGTEPHPWSGGKPSKALGLTTAFHQAFEKLDDQGAGIAHVIIDQNGERPRALEWALTEGRIFPDPEKERSLLRPALVTGDAGTALAAVLLADAFARLILSTSPDERIALAVSDDGGDRRVLCLEHVEQPERETLFTNLRRQLGGKK